jgi:hypothetical protein
MLMPDGLLDSLDDDSGRLRFCDGHAGESDAGDWSRRWTAVATAANLDLFAGFHPRLASLTRTPPSGILIIFGIYPGIVEEESSEVDRLFGESPDESIPIGAQRPNAPQCAPRAVVSRQRRSVMRLRFSEAG